MIGQNVIAYAKKYCKIRYFQNVIVSRCFPRTPTTDFDLFNICQVFYTTLSSKVALLYEMFACFGAKCIV